MVRDATLPLDSFTVDLTAIAKASVEDLMTLSMAVGWPHRPDDWRAVLDLGEGVVARDPIGRALGCAMWFPMGADFATIGMVITSPRVQALGAGSRMMAMALDALGDRDIGLNATRSAKRLYLSLGFVAECPVFQHQGTVRLAASLGAVSGVLRPLEHGDLVEALDLDHRAHGGDRSLALRSLLSEGRGLALERNGRVVAYSCVRRFGRGHVIGPIVAENDADAIGVTAPHLKALAGRFARVDTRERDGAFSAALLESGLPVFDTVTTMSRGRRWIPRDADAGVPRVFGLISQAMG